jgi:hypothetical protein
MRTVHNLAEGMRFYIDSSLPQESRPNISFKRGGCYAAAPQTPLKLAAFVK